MTPEQAAQKYHWVKFDREKYTIELYLDNYMLSNARVCESKFVLDHFLWLKPKYGLNIQVPDGKILRKPWFLDFGEFIHYCLETFYDHFKAHKCPPEVGWWMDECKKKWDEMKMDDYYNSIMPQDVKKYEELEGWQGACGLLIEYYAFYMDLRVRVIDTEITFGHNKEVFLGEWTEDFNIELQEKIKRLGKKKYIRVPLTVKCYLTGRIDLLVDNGYKIGPVDHKTTASFDGYEHLDFNPHDGLTGYILAINSILDKYKRNGLTNIPVSGGGWIYHISTKRPSQPKDKTKKPGPRFKTTPVDKTKQQLEDYKMRQISTFRRISELLFHDKAPEWNTSVCNNLYFRRCEYAAIHEQPSDQWASIISRFYTIDKAWDTRDMSKL